MLFRSHLGEPARDLLQARPAVVGPGSPQPRHQVVVGPAQYRTAVLHLVAPGNALRVGPAPEVVLGVAPRRGTGTEAPVVEVGAG